MHNEKPLTIAILIDALGWQLVQEHKFLADIAKWRYNLRTVLGFSSSAIPTILSGKPANRIGLWNSIYYSPQTSPFRWLKWFGWIPDQLLENRYARFIIRKISHLVCGYTGYFSDFAIPSKFLPNFDTCEKKNIYEPGGIEGGSLIFDELITKGIPYRAYSYKQLSDSEIFKQATKDVTAGKHEFFFLYLCELDAFLHKYIGDREAVAQKVRWYEDKITELFAAASKRHNVQLHVFSDHGMVPTQSNYDLIKDIKNLGFHEGKDYVAMYDSTMARFWFKNSASEKAFRGLLKNLAVGKIIEKNELINEEVYFEDGRFGELIFLMNPGTLIVPSYMSFQSVPGMHGFAPDHPQMEAAYLSTHAPAEPPWNIKDIKSKLCNAS